MTKSLASVFGLIDRFIWKSTLTVGPTRKVVKRGWILTNYDRNDGLR